MPKPYGYHTIGRRLQDYGRGRFNKDNKRKWPKEAPYEGPPDLEKKPSRQPLVQHKIWPWMRGKKSDKKPDVRFWISAAEAANMLNMHQRTFWEKYIRTKRLAYIVKKRYFGNGYPTRKGYVQRAAINELLSAMILSGASNSEHKIKRALSVIRGLDEVTRTLQGRSPRTTKKPRFLSGTLKRRDDSALRTEDDGPGGTDPRRDRTSDS